MTSPDVELLRWLATISMSVGEVVRTMLNRTEDGRLCAGDLRSVGQELVALGADMVHRADELDHQHMIDTGDAQ